MAKRLLTLIKLQIPAGKATPAPPIGPAIGQHGVNIPAFCSQFNTATAQLGDTIVPVEISVYEDKSFTFIMKTAPAAVLIRKILNLPKGSGEPNKNKIGKLTKAQVKTIAETKMPDLNASNIEAAINIIAGTARSMGVDVES